MSDERRVRYYAPTYEVVLAGLVSQTGLYFASYFAGCKEHVILFAQCKGVDDERVGKIMRAVYKTALKSSDVPAHGEKGVIAVVADGAYLITTNVPLPVTLTGVPYLAKDLVEVRRHAMMTAGIPEDLAEYLLRERSMWVRWKTRKGESG